MSEEEINKYQKLDIIHIKVELINKEIYKEYSFKNDKIQKIVELDFNLGIHSNLIINSRLKSK